MSRGEIRIERDGHVALCILDHPPNNHVTVELMRRLADAFAALDDDRECRAILLASEGRVFCGGADLANRGDDRILGDPDVNPLYTEAVRLFSNRKPIVAAVQGAAVGAGLGLALVADFRIAGPEARFAANFVKLGFHPGFGISHTLSRIVGTQFAALMLETGRRIKADEALARGLVDAVVPAESVRTSALELAREIAENAPLAVQSTRATLRAGLAAAVKAQTDHEHAEQRRLIGTADFAEGVRAVAERRPGRFRGE